MNVGDIMTQEVTSIGPEGTIAEAARLMLSERISGLPVVGDNHALLGIVTEGDLLRRAELKTEKTRPRWLEFFVGDRVLAAEYAKSHARHVRDVMTTNIVVASEEMPLEKAVALMERHHVKRLPVLREGRLVGIISRANLLRSLTAGYPHASTSRKDKVIKDHIERELQAHSWGRILHRQVMVAEGAVDLWGFVTGDRQRDAIRIAVENVPGVKSVRDHLVWLEPHTGIIINETGEVDLPGPLAK